MSQSTAEGAGEKGSSPTSRRANGSPSLSKSSPQKSSPRKVGGRGPGSQRGAEDSAGGEDEEDALGVTLHAVKPKSSVSASDRKVPGRGAHTSARSSPYKGSSPRKLPSPTKLDVEQKTPPNNFSPETTASPEKRNSRGRESEFRFSGEAQAGVRASSAADASAASARASLPSSSTSEEEQVSPSALDARLQAAYRHAPEQLPAIVGDFTDDAVRFGKKLIDELCYHIITDEEVNRCRLSDLGPVAIRKGVFYRLVVDADDHSKDSTEMSLNGEIMGTKMWAARRFEI